MSAGFENMQSSRMKGSKHRFFLGGVYYCIIGRPNKPCSNFFLRVARLLFFLFSCCWKMTKLCPGTYSHSFAPFTLEPLQTHTRNDHSQVQCRARQWHRHHRYQGASYQGMTYKLNRTLCWSAFFFSQWHAPKYVSNMNALHFVYIHVQVDPKCRYQCARRCIQVQLKAVLLKVYI